MNKLLVIENDLNDFNKVKEIFDDCWQILPENHRDIDYTNNTRIVNSITNAIQNGGISSIILDISLLGDEGEEGFEVLEKIREIDKVEYKTIPIYCYSRHGNDKAYRNKAFKMGATNIFAKGNIDKPESDDILFLKKSLTALAFIYTSVCDYSMDMKDVINQIGEINNSLKSIDKTTKVNLNAILQLSSYQDIFNLVEINETNRQSIAEVVGGEDALNNLLQIKWFKDDKENQEKLIDDVADIFANIPVLSSFAAILKGITLISKNAK